MSDEASIIVDRRASFRIITLNRPQRLNAFNEEMHVALHCDIVLAARSAKFIQAFAKIGVVPDAGGTWLLPRLIGMARARGLALLGETLSAETAQAWGLIWKAVDDDRLMAEAGEMCAQLAAGPTIGLGLIKR